MNYLNQVGYIGNVTTMRDFTSPLDLDRNQGNQRQLMKLEGTIKVFYSSDQVGDKDSRQ